jgi:hypothetical protein
MEKKDTKQTPAPTELALEKVGRLEEVAHGPTLLLLEGSHLLRGHIAMM